ncbi:MAG TPA: hypothetical protein VGQ57_11560 [Polyangiaceae bacterium]|jgi:hypothetical protein|nr:hypothetical protein [Polyangiaceae bacterium]
MPLLELGPSYTAVGLVAFGLGLVALGLAVVRTPVRELAARIPSRVLVGGLAALAALLSWAYVVRFLHGGPRIVDATSYFLQARALAEGHFAFRVPEPSAAFRGRFSLLGPSGLSVIFPPGYALALAAGFRAGVPMLVGPLLAALLVIATYVGTRELFEREDAARVAAVLSTLCATLRYHTADTMSHGLSALLLVTSLALAARPSLLRAVFAGLCAGWLVATRPMTGAVAVALVAVLIVARSPRRERPLFALMFAGWLTPGLLLLVVHQHAATGSFWRSTQLTYYALADGPPGCFRWGFGPNVGCRFEHGDFVKRHLQGGFGPLAALRTLFERLAWHAFDVANLAPAALLVPWVAWRHRLNPGVRIAAVAVAGVMLVYVPFYYPGSYPGGGARFFADALPLEHALLGLALVELDLVRFAVPGALLGFALSTIHSHLALAEREGGRPMYEPARVPAPRRGLLFTNTDHGFALGHDPKRRDPKRELVVARGHGDAHDRILWEHLGRPPASRYEYFPDTGRVAITPYDPTAGTARWELEVEWPPLAVSSGWAHPDFRPCLSAGAGLHLRPTPTASIEVELGAPVEGDYEIILGWLADPNAVLELVVRGARQQSVHRTSGCEATSLGVIHLGPTNRIGVTTQASVLLDYFELRRANAKYR